jgi:hypothetical protein
MSPPTLRHSFAAHLRRRLAPQLRARRSWLLHCQRRRPDADTDAYTRCLQPFVNAPLQRQPGSLLLPAMQRPAGARLLLLHPQQRPRSSASVPTGAMSSPACSAAEQQPMPRHSHEAGKAHVGESRVLNEHCDQSAGPTRRSCSCRSLSSRSSRLRRCRRAAARQNAMASRVLALRMRCCHLSSSSSCTTPAR